MKSNDGRLNGPSQAEPVVSALRDSVPDATTRLNRLSAFMAEQEEREAVVDWIRKRADKAFLPQSVYRELYDIADAIELGEHRAQGMETRQGGNEVPSQSDDSPVACDAPKACSEDTSHDH